MRARTLRFFLNLWPPFVGAGIHVTGLAEDYREAIVEWSAVVALDRDSELGRAAAEGIDVLRPMVGLSGP